MKNNNCYIKHQDSPYIIFRQTIVNETNWSLGWYPIPGSIVQPARIIREAIEIAIMNPVMEKYPVRQYDLDSIGKREIRKNEDILYGCSQKLTWDHVTLSPELIPIMQCKSFKLTYDNYWQIVHLYHYLSHNGIIYGIEADNDIDEEDPECLYSHLQYLGSDESIEDSERDIILDTFIIDVDEEKLIEERKKQRK